MALRTAPLVATAAVLLAVRAGAATPVELTLAQAQERTGPDSVPAHLGRLVTVRGTVTAPPVWVLDSHLLAIADEAGYGFALRGQPSDFGGAAPGDQIAATGTIAQRGGMAVLTGFAIEKLGTTGRPGLAEVAIEQLERFRYLGLPVTTEGSVLEVRREDAGDSLLLGSGRGSVRFFVPKPRGDAIIDALARFHAGDFVRVRGLAVQQCLLPPYDRSIEIVAYEPDAVTLLERRPGAVQRAVVLTVLLAALAGLVWYLWKRRQVRRQNALRALNALGEQILGAGSAAEILAKLTDVIPAVCGAAGVHLYELDRKTRTLNRIPTPDHPDPLPVNPEAPVGPIAAGVALAFRSRAVVNIPDTRRSPLFAASATTDAPRSVTFTPMFTQDEALGVIEVDHTGAVRHFSREEQAALQHLANQVAAVLRSLEQQAVRERLFHSERMAATAQLATGVAAELKAPLEHLLAASSRLLARPIEPGIDRELNAVAREAQRASGIVARLASLGRAEAAPRIVEVNDLLSNLIRFREREMKAQGIHIVEKRWSEPLYVMAAQGQLEQAFLSILVHAEQCLRACAEKTLTVRGSKMAGRAAIEIAFACGEDAADPFAAQPGTEGAGPALAVVRGIVLGHGGDARFSRTAKSCSIEIELPAAEPEPRAPRAGGAGRRGRTLTTLVVDADPVRQRSLVKELAARNHRVVPVARADEALDLAGRMRFDIVMCAARQPGLNWMEFLERTREQVGGYVLVGAGARSAAAGGVEGSWLAIEDPANDAAFEQVMSQAESAAEGAPAAHVKSPS